MWLILLFSIFAHAEKMCDESVIKATCEKVQVAADKEFLIDREDAKWKNPFYKKGKELTASKIAEVVEANIETQSELLTILDQISVPSKLSNKFKMAFVGNAYDALQERPSRTTFSLPLPMSDEKAKFQSISKERVLEIFKSFPEREQKQILDISQKISTVAESKPSSDPKITEKNKKRIEKYFNETRSILINYILAGRKYEDISPNEKILIDRYKIIKLVHGDQIKGENECEEGVPNGFLDITNYTLNVCPGYYDSPEVQLLRFFGHEMSHLVDPCSVEFYIFSYLDKGEKRYSIDPYDENGGPRRSEAISGMRREDHPFYQVDQCLVKQFNVRDIGEEDILASAKVEATYDKKALNLSEEEAKAREEQIIEELRAKSLCFGTMLMASEINEAMADIYGNVVLEKYLEKNPPKTDEEKLAIFGVDLKRTCGEPEPYYFDLNYKAKREKFTKRHPQDNLRSNIILQVPSVAKAFSCKPDPKRMCLEKRIIPTAKSSVEPQSTKGAQ